MNLFKKTKGYTLIEIVVVIGIMGFLSAIVYSSFDASRAKSRDQKRITDISVIQLALEQHFQKNGIYPLLLENLVPTFLPAIPTDPTNNYSDQYFPMSKTKDSNSCISYQLWTKFELRNSYLDSKKGFNSKLSPLPSGMFECGYNHIKAEIDATSDPLIYDVMPF